MRPCVLLTATSEIPSDVGTTNWSVAMSDFDAAIWTQRGTWPAKSITKQYDSEFAAGMTYFLLLWWLLCCLRGHWSVIVPRGGCCRRRRPFPPY